MKRFLTVLGDLVAFLAICGGLWLALFIGAALQ